MPTATATRADRFRQLADAMQPAIDAKMEPGVARQNPTPRRMRQLDQSRRDGERMQRVQLKLRAIAEATDAGTLPEVLQAVKSRTDVETLLSYERAQKGLAQAEWDAARAALAALGGELLQATPIEREIRDRERDLVGRKLPGFFPTPAPIVARLMDLADIRPGMRVLEPSAGKGDIAEAIRAAGGDVTTVEIQQDLVKILALKGFEVMGVDFLALDPLGPLGGSMTFDRIVGNPPFEDAQDIDHVRHAYKFLRPGGRLVMIMSEGPFGRERKKDKEFRDWFASLDGVSMKMDGAFLKSFRATSVATRIVVIDRAP